MKTVCLRYKYFVMLLLVGLIINILWPVTGHKAAVNTWQSLLGVAAVFPPIFILLGLLDVWVERERLIKYMGDQSGATGALIAFLLGSVAAGPLYAAFPLAGILIKKGSSLMNALIFIGAWSTTRIPMLLFEVSAMGWEFTIIRFFVNIPGILLIAYITDRALSDKERKELQKKATA